MDIFQAASHRVSLLLKQTPLPFLLCHLLLLKSFLLFSFSFLRFEELEIETDGERRPNTLQREEVPRRAQALTHIVIRGKAIIL